MTDLLERDAEALERIADHRWRANQRFDDLDLALYSPTLRRAARLMRLVGENRGVLGRAAQVCDYDQRVRRWIGGTDRSDAKRLRALATYGSEEGEGDDE